AYNFTPGGSTGAVTVLVMALFALPQPANATTPTVRDVKGVLRRMLSLSRVSRHLCCTGAALKRKPTELRALVCPAPSRRETPPSTFGDLPVRWETSPRAFSAKPQADLGPGRQRFLGCRLLAYHHELMLVLGGPGDPSQLAVSTPQQPFGLRERPSRELRDHALGRWREEPGLDPP